MMLGPWLQSLEYQPAVAETSSRTLLCGVLFAELVDWARLPASEQLRRKRLLKAQVAQELVQVPMADRVAHDIETGIAVAFLVDAEAALVAAIGLQAGAAGPLLRMGLSLGTVHIVKDLGGQTAIVGEGVNDAQRVAADAAPGQVLAASGFREVVSRLSPNHAAVFRVVALRNDARGREHEIFEVHIAASATPAPARGAQDAASVFDAGPHLIISAYERAVVQKALDELAAKGARVVSPITRVGDKWMASCEHPDVRASECKVEIFGLTSVVTGPTRQAVMTKVQELIERGARLTGEVEQDGGVWTAVCDSGGAGG
jgi:class 3 adenylate cyclase